MDMVSGLSPSSLDLWEQCERRFLFEKLERRAGDKASYDSLRGTLVHLILEKLMQLPARGRSIRVARTCAAEAWEEFTASKEWLEWEGREAQDLRAFKRSAWASVCGYFEIEDPRSIDVVATEAMMETTFDGVPVRGIVDRLEVDVFDDLTVSDYKGLALDTRLPTPTGWATMAEVRVGDEVFGVDGRPVRVTGKSKIHHRECFRITFDDGSTVVADAVHLWRVEKDSGVEILSTRELRENLWTTGSKPQRDCRIPNPEPLDLPDLDLPLDPWVLGYWLGNGKRSSGEITWGDDSIPDVVKGRGFELGSRGTKPDSQAITATVLGARTALREMGLLGHKMVPDSYLRASRTQRLAFLQGLMDSDGSWNPLRSQAVFVNCDKGLALAVHELVVSLGMRASWWEGRGSGFGKVVHQYRVSFTPVGCVPFLSSKKRGVSPRGATKSRRRLVVSVEPVPSVPTQCIEVESPDSLYLCGDSMIPTHNSGKVPAPPFRAPKIRQLNFYGAMIEELRDERPGEGRLLFTTHSEVISTTFDAESLGRVREDVVRVWDEILEGIRTEKFEPNPGPLCGWCPFAVECPEGEQAVRRRAMDSSKSQGPAVAALAARDAAEAS